MTVSMSGGKPFTKEARSRQGAELIGNTDNTVIRIIQINDTYSYILNLDLL